MSQHRFRDVIFCKLQRLLLHSCWLGIRVRIGQWGGELPIRSLTNGLVSAGVCLGRRPVGLEELVIQQGLDVVRWRWHHKLRGHGVHTTVGRGGSMSSTIVLALAIVSLLSLQVVIVAAVICTICNCIVILRTIIYQQCCEFNRFLLNLLVK